MYNKGKLMYSLENYFKNELTANDISKIHFTNKKKIKNLGWFNRKYYKYIPSYEYFEDALVLPGKIRDTKNVEDVVYTSSLEPVKLSRLSRTHQTPIASKNPLLSKSTQLIKNADYIEGKCVYGGLIDNAFGHFIGETLSRLWIICGTIEIKDDVTFIFHKKTEEIDLDYLEKSKYIEYFYMLGIKREQIKIITKPCICKSLLVPEQGIKYRNACSLEMAKLWDRIKIAANKDQVIDEFSKNKYKKIYFSRSSIVNPVGNRALLNEKELEKFLENKGFNIVHPHELKSEKEKIMMLSKAEVLIGLSGSGLHNAVFMNDNASVIQIVNPVKSNGFEVQNAISMVKNITLDTIIINEPGISDEWTIDLEKLEKLLVEIIEE